MLTDNILTAEPSAPEPAELCRSIQREAERLAGDNDDMVQRASAYHRIYILSGGNLVFPLIAAHGALWARWYLPLTRAIAWGIAWLDVSCLLSPFEKMRRLTRFVDTFKEINREVFIACFVSFELARTMPRAQLIELGYPDDVAEALDIASTAAAERTTLDTATRRSLYETFFRWEQTHVVGPRVVAALEEFDWPLMQWICVRPWVWLSYFRPGRSLNFRDFSDAEERIEKGLIAFDRAASLGWDNIEANLLRNPLFRQLPTDDRCDP